MWTKLHTNLWAKLTHKICITMFKYKFVEKIYAQNKHCLNTNLWTKIMHTKLYNYCNNYKI
jgi:hypothetical protein